MDCICFLFCSHDSAVDRQKVCKGSYLITHAQGKRKDLKVCSYEMTIQGGCESLWSQLPLAYFPAVRLWEEPEEDWVEEGKGEDPGPSHTPKDYSKWSQWKNSEWIYLFIRSMKK